MKKSKIIFTALLMVLIFIAGNLTGRTVVARTNWIVPATVADNDTIPVVNLPVVIIK